LASYAVRFEQLKKPFKTFVTYQKFEIKDTKSAFFNVQNQFTFDHIFGYRLNSPVFKQISQTIANSPSSV